MTQGSFGLALMELGIPRHRVKYLADLIKPHGRKAPVAQRLELTDLTPRARRIYANLKAAVKHRDC